MQLQFTPYVLPVAASAILLTALAVTAGRLRPAPGAISFCLLMLAMAEWSLAYALELTSHALTSALFWDNVTWIGAVAAPTLWLVFALRYTERAKWLTNRYLPFLAVEPIVTLLLVWTNGTHGLVEQVSLNTSGPFSALAITYGLWYWINIAYSYTLLFLGAFILASYILTAARSSHLYSVQGACLLLAVAAPWVGNFLTISGLNPLPYLNLTPFAFIISGLAFWVGLFIFRLLDVVPIAREVVIEHMREAAIVLDRRNRVVDLNPPAQRLSNCRSAKAIGRPFDEVFQAWPELVQHCQNPKEIDEEVIAGKGEGPNYYGLHATPLYHRNGHPTISGRLIVLHDITERIEAERALKESEGRFRSIFEEVPIGIAVVDLQGGQLLQVNKAFC
jgi:PAS domain S-box-containing protein